MCAEDYRWHYDYVRLAWDAGFLFEKCKYPNIDKNKICLVDIDRIIKERDVASVERFLPTVVQFVLDNDQAELLDTNFVKMFRISQLSVEYLLFCKKYLDNTVVLLKKEIAKLKEGNKELKLFTEDLEKHISTLTKHNFGTTFKCGKCPKVFSTEEYLSSHKKRRHSIEDNVVNNTETDQLQSEIKQLKERLNIAEKLLQEKDEKSQNVKLDTNEDESKLRINEILEKFEKFKEKVEDDLKILQIQKNFYEEKYSKLFDVVFESNRKENVIMESVQQTRPLNTNTHQNYPQEKSPTLDSVDKIETTTQTEKENVPPKKLQIETVHHRNIYEFKDSETDSESIRKKNKIEDTIEQKINHFEEQIELKISSGLDNIEKQMQAFWGKLSEMELKREENVTVRGDQNVPQQEVLQIEALKPKIKPRMKLSKPSKLVEDNGENARKLKAEIDKMYIEPEVTVKSAHSAYTLKIPGKFYESSSSSESESKSDSESKTEEVLPKKIHKNKPSLSVLPKRSVKRLENAPKSKEKFRNEINKVMNTKLQEMGISPNWTGIPQKTFEKSIEIIQHQAHLIKKSYPNFDSVRKSIETSINNNKDTVQKKNNRTIINSTNKPNVINIRYRKKPKDFESESESKPSVITIKNRSLYNTDSESEDLQFIRPTVKTSEAVPAYSAVIQELKASQPKNVDTDSDVNSIILPKEDATIEVHTKGVLKNYPSVGSLTKKKVLFDIESDDKAEVDQSEAKRETISDSSDVVKDVDDKKLKKNDSLSDFDLSEL